jgi:hypothetical protein
LLEALNLAPPRKAKKQLIRRSDVDRSQLYGRSFQRAFFVLNLWLGARFYFWVRQYEAGLIDTNLRRPAGVEGWLPIAGLMNLKYCLLSGNIPLVRPAALFLLLTFLAMALLFRKAFAVGFAQSGRSLNTYGAQAGKSLSGIFISRDGWTSLSAARNIFSSGFSSGQFRPCRLWGSAISCSAHTD